MNCLGAKFGAWAGMGVEPAVRRSFEEGIPKPYFTVYWSSLKAIPNFSHVIF